MKLILAAVLAATLVTPKIYAQDDEQWKGRFGIDREAEWVIWMGLALSASSVGMSIAETISPEHFDKESERIAILQDETALFLAEDNGEPGPMLGEIIAKFRELSGDDGQGVSDREIALRLLGSN